MDGAEQVTYILTGFGMAGLVVLGLLVAGAVWIARNLNR